MALFQEIQTEWIENGLMGSFCQKGNQCVFLKRRKILLIGLNKIP